MTVKELYRNFLLQLQGIYSLGEATVISDLVFENIAALKKQDLIKDPTLELNNTITAKLAKALAQLIQHKPVQYILGESWFYHVLLKVNEDVLIPRPETEELVDLLLHDQRNDIYTLKQAGSPRAKGMIHILDIGTGSGCIPIAIKKNLPAANITAIDCSEKALQLAKENARLHQTDIHFIQIDFLDETQWDQFSLFDIIISNPPYIPYHEKKQLADNVVAYEPHTALFVPDDNPLLFYEKIARFGKSHLKATGIIYLETHADLAGDVARLFQPSYSNVDIKKDLSGKERMVKVFY